MSRLWWGVLAGLAAVGVLAAAAVLVIGWVVLQVLTDLPQ
jgi:hypothetical protein